MINVQIITTEGCHHCARAKEIFKELQPTYPQMRVEEIEATSERGMELISNHGIFQSPGILINSELFSTGGLDKKKFIEKLDSLR